MRTKQKRGRALSAAELDSVMRAAMAEPPTHVIIEPVRGRTTKIYGELDKPCWCEGCDQLIESRWMRWDFGLFRCLGCLEGVAVPVWDGSRWDTKALDVNNAVAQGICSPNEARNLLLDG